MLFRGSINRKFGKCQGDSGKWIGEESEGQTTHLRPWHVWWENFFFPRSNDMERDMVGNKHSHCLMHLWIVGAFPGKKWRALLAMAAVVWDFSGLPWECGALSMDSWLCWAFIEECGLMENSHIHKILAWEYVWISIPIEALSTTRNKTNKQSAAPPDK